MVIGRKLHGVMRSQKQRHGMLNMNAAACPHAHVHRNAFIYCTSDNDCVFCTCGDTIGSNVQPHIGKMQRCAGSEPSKCT